MFSAVIVLTSFHLLFDYKASELYPNNSYSGRHVYTLSFAVMESDIRS